MGTYLENYLESVSSLPQEVRRNFALLRELDTRAQELIEKVEKNTKNYLKNAKRPRKDDDEDEQDIKTDLKTCIELSDEKVALAVQTYELVDKHIRRLDTDLKKFELELEQQGSNVKDLKTAQPEKKPAEKRKSAVSPNKIEVPSDARVLNVILICQLIQTNQPIAFVIEFHLEKWLDVTILNVKLNGSTLNVLV